LTQLRAVIIASAHFPTDPVGVRADPMIKAAASRRLPPARAGGPIASE
jgi:hypothetical protein